MAVQMITLDEVSNIVISILVMQLLKKFGQLKDSTIWKIRVVFMVSQLVQLVLLLIVRRSLNATNDQRKVKVPKQNGVAVGEEDEEEEITYNEYDRREYKKLYKSMMLQLVVSGLCHLKWNIIQPLIIQSIGTVKFFFLKPLVLAHVRGKEVQRPFENNWVFRRTPMHEKPAKKKKKDD
eukprot:jgi/Antlo1/2303/5